MSPPPEDMKLLWSERSDSNDLAVNLPRTARDLETTARDETPQTVVSTYGCSLTIINGIILAERQLTTCTTETIHPTKKLVVS